MKRWLIGATALVVLAPTLLAAGLNAVLAPETENSCGASGAARPGPGRATGIYAQPLRLERGHWYEVGATEYGGPGDPTAGDYGAIADPAQAYLPAHPDSYAELSLLASNPANATGLTFADADALGALPYMTGLRVEHDGRQALIYKRDIGYGQGPGQTIANGQPYRLDLWWQAAAALGVTKSAVRIALAPASGAAATLEQTAAPVEANGGIQQTTACAAPDGIALLALAPGTATRILPSGLAAAGAEAPAPVRAMVAAGNRLDDTAYLYGAGHGPPLDQLQPAYDCSSAVSYVLHRGGVLGASALDSGELARYGLPGPGRYVTVYANAAHAFMYVAGLRLDTVEDPAYDKGPNAGKAGARWRLSSEVPAWATWSVRHPPGL